MYAIDHAATALVVKHEYKQVPLIWLLVAAQVMEILWVILNYIGVEHIQLVNGVVQLGYLPFSHSIASGLVLGFLGWFFGAKILHQPVLGIALAISVVSHLVLDLIQHQADIAIAPFVSGPMFGLGLTNFPYLDLAVETIYGIARWWIYKGSKALLAAIVIFNLINLPLMLHLPFPGTVTVGTADFITATIIGVQILVTWFFVWWLAREPSRRAGMAVTAHAAGE